MAFSHATAAMTVDRAFAASAAYAYFYGFRYAG